MKQIAIYIAVIILQLPVQQNYSQKMADAGSGLVEKVHVLTDREVYCVGEHIHFKAFNLSDDSLRLLEWSKVLYIEIITPGGIPICKEKYYFNKNGSSGTIKIPVNSLSGNYYLKAYTKWMRNFPLSGYFFKIVKIINPYDSFLLHDTNTSEPQWNFVHDTIENKSKITIDIPNREISRRQHVELVISSNYSTSHIFSISILKKDYYYEDTYMSSNNIEHQFSPQFIPETRGASLTGKIIQQKDSSIIPLHPLQATIFGNPNKLMLSKTNKKGHFAINMQNGATHVSSNEIFVQCNLINDSIGPLILIDNDFCTRKVRLPFVPLDLSGQRKKILSSLCLYTQILNQFRTDENGSSKKRAVQKKVFYGKPDQHVTFKDYVELPGIEDYILELVPFLAIQQKKGKSYFKFQGDNYELNFYDPLILIDMVPVCNISQLLKVSPRKIDCLEMIRTPYKIGEQTFGGIVAFYSVNNDMAGIELPSWGRFIHFSYPKEQGGPNFSITHTKRTPDLRNTLFWQPSLHLKPKEKKTLSFQTSDIPGEYIIVVKTIDKHGKKDEKTHVFEVK